MLLPLKLFAFFGIGMMELLILGILGMGMLAVAIVVIVVVTRKQ